MIFSEKNNSKDSRKEHMGVFRGKKEKKEMSTSKIRKIKINLSHEHVQHS